MARKTGPKAKTVKSKMAQMLKAVESVLTNRTKRAAANTPKPKDPAESVLWSYGKAKYNQRTDWWVIYSDREQPIPVAKADGRGATRRSGNNCLFARSIKRSSVGQHIDGVDVGTNITKIWSEQYKVEVRFHTSTELAKAVREWDKPNGKWILPDSQYWLRAYPPSLRVGYKTRKPRVITPGKTVGRKKQPSRRILNIHDNVRAIKALDGITRAKKRA